MILLKTIIEHSMETGVFYGGILTKNEFEAMNNILLFLKNDYLHNVESLLR